MTPDPDPALEPALVSEPRVKFQGHGAATNVTLDPALEPAPALEPRVGVIFNKKSNRKQEKYQRWAQLALLGVVIVTSRVLTHDLYFLESSQIMLDYFF